MLVMLFSMSILKELKNSLKAVFVIALVCLPELSAILSLSFVGYAWAGGKAIGAKNVLIDYRAGFL